MDEPQRVTFRFGSDTQIHYLAQAPRPGEHVTHGRELWVVTSVEQDAVGTLVICEQTADTQAPSARR